jgi:phosphohistidine phosphatase SixA
MRHGQAFRPGMDPDTRVRGSSLTTTGLSDARAVAHRFAEAVTENGIDATEVTIVCAPSREAQATAAALAAQLGKAAAAVPLQALDPADWPPRTDEDAPTRWKKIDAEIDKLGAPARAVVVVGHDPQASWLLHHLIAQGGRGQRGAGPLPLARGELAMLGAPRGEPLALRWVLSPSDKASIEQLQAKIKSKMDSAKLLGAFLTALLLFAARELAAAENPPAWYPWVAGGGLVLLATATAAYFVTMFKYDELLMPVRFWPSPRRSRGGLPRGFVLRPPSSAAWILYQNMMWVWYNAFIPATLLGGAGAIAVTVALARPHDLWWLAAALSIAVVVAATWLISRRATPRLGVSD